MELRACRVFMACITFFFFFWWFKRENLLTVTKRVFLLSKTHCIVPPSPIGRRYGMTSISSVLLSELSNSHWLVKSVAKRNLQKSSGA